MTEKEKQFTPTMKCGHCNNKAPMEIIATANKIETVIYKENDLELQEGPVWEVLLCPACLKATLRGGHYFEPDGEDVGYEILYPRTNESIAELPAAVNSAYEAAIKVRSIDPNAYAVLLGRVLDKVCMDRGAEGKSLSDRLKFLAEKGEIPSRLAEMAQQLRQLRNIGAHAELGDLTEKEIPLLSDLCTAILEYTYHAPALIDRVNRHFKARHKKG